MKMTLEERIRACVTSHPDWDDKRVANSTRGHKADIVTIRSGGSLPLDLQPISSSYGGVLAPGESVSGLVSMDKVMARYDIKSAILREVGSISKGSLMAESELLLRTSGQDRQRFRRVVENNEAEFKPLRVKLKLDDSADGKWYWGHAETVADAVRIRDL